MIFLGTGAAECYPNPFCTCPSCTAALHSQDKKLKRRRSALLLDEHNLIDFGPDIMPACAEYGRSLASLENVFLTHLHEDHFSFWNIGFLEMSVTPVHPLNLYLSQAACDGLLSILESAKHLPHSRLTNNIEKLMSLVNLTVIKPYTPYFLPLGKMTALVGNHRGFFEGERSLNYLFETSSGSLLYASDTGRFLPQTYETLFRRHVDHLVIEGTFGMRELPPDAGHLDRVSLCETIDALTKIGAVSKETQIFVTHIGHKGGYTHYDYEAFLQERYGERIALAYDGLLLNFPKNLP